MFIGSISKYNAFFNPKPTQQVTMATKPLVRSAIMVLQAIETMYDTETISENIATAAYMLQAAAAATADAAAVAAAAAAAAAAEQSYVETTPEPTPWSSPRATPQPMPRATPQPMSRSTPSPRSVPLWHQQFFTFVLHDLLPEEPKSARVNKGNLARMLTTLADDEKVKVQDIEFCTWYEHGLHGPGWNVTWTFSKHTSLENAVDFPTRGVTYRKIGELVFRPSAPKNFD
jgi:hypothetical protein